MSSGFVHAKLLLSSSSQPKSRRVVVDVDSVSGQECLAEMGSEAKRLRYDGSICHRAETNEAISLTGFSDVHGSKGKAVKRRGGGGGFGYQRPQLDNKSKVFRSIKQKKSDKRQFTRWFRSVMCPCNVLDDTSRSKKKYFRSWMLFCNYSRSRQTK